MPAQLMSDIAFVQEVIERQELLELLLELGIMTKSQVKLIHEKSFSEADIEKLLDDMLENEEIFDKLFQKGSRIPKRLVIKFNKEYSRMLRTRHPIPREGRPGFLGESSACWFSLEELKEFMDANGLDINNPSGMGVRIYFAMYLPSMGHKWMHRLTAILVPTFSGFTTEDQDRNVVDYPVPPGESPESGEVYLSFAGLPEDMQEDGQKATVEYAAFNHGKLCPPSGNCIGAIYT